MAGVCKESETVVKCEACGAVSTDPGNKKRFLRRHPDKCRKYSRDQKLRRRLSTVSDDSPGKPVVSSEEKIKATAAMLTTLEAEGHRLSSWEQEFLVSISDRFFIGGEELSIKQYLKLEQIYRRLF